MGTMFQNEVIMVRLFNNIVAFYDIWVLQLLMYFDLLLQQLQVLFILADSSFVDHFYGELLSGVIG